MTPQDLYNLWRPCGGQWWDELSDAEQNRWDTVYHHVRGYGRKQYDKGHAAGRETR